MERGSVDVNDEPRPGSARLGRRAFDPDVLADAERRRDPLDRYDGGAGAWGKITLLVEDAVVRELLFVVSLGYHASPDQGAGVVQAARVRMRMAQDDRDPRNRTRDPLQGLCYGPGEARAQEQVLGGIARQSQLGEDDEPGAQGIARLRCGLDHARRVARDVADPEVELGERDAQPGHTVRLQRNAGTFQPLRQREMAGPISAGERTVTTPAASKASNLASAVPLPREMMAPAWPMRFPGGAVTPAI